MNILKKLSTLSSLFLLLFFFVTPTFAAAPDGAGPWADSVFSSSQGLMKNGLAVPVLRSDPTSAVGIAEFNFVEGNFFSLGFGGSIALGFDNGVSNGAIIIETTNPGYPGELAQVEMSEDGITWVMAGNVTQDGVVNQPAGVACAKYVRITDISNPNDFSDATADGYDVDGVQATGTACPATPTPTATPAPTNTPNNPSAPGDGLSDGRSDGRSSGGVTTTVATNVVPGFPNAGSSGCQKSANPLIPCLPNTGFGPGATTMFWNITHSIQSIFVSLLKTFIPN